MSYVYPGIIDFSSMGWFNTTGSFRIPQQPHLRAYYDSCARFFTKLVKEPPLTRMPCSMIYSPSNEMVYLGKGRWIESQAVSIDISYQTKKYFSYFMTDVDVDLKFKYRSTGIVQHPGGWKLTISAKYPEGYAFNTETGTSVVAKGETYSLGVSLGDTIDIIWAERWAPYISGTLAWGYIVIMDDTYNEKKNSVQLNWSKNPIENNISVFVSQDKG